MRARDTRAVEAISGVLGLLLLTACHALSDPGIEYKDCVPPKMPYSERFDDDEQTLLDRCWHTENALPEDVKIGQDGDLIVTHAEPVAWDGTPPMLLRRIEGDFVIVTKTEASSGLNSNFCGLEPGDASGIIVRGADAQVTFLVRPYLEQSDSITCEDESENPPRAIAFATSSATPSVVASSPGIGFDGEADIALCRRGNQLAYFFRNPDDPDADWEPADWQQLKDPDDMGTTDTIGPGPLDVGLTTTVTEEGVDLGVEGHFNWVAVLDLTEDCMGPLEDFQPPEED